MIISTDARIIQYPFIIKTLSDLGMERKILTNKKLLELMLQNTRSIQKKSIVH